MNILRKVKSGLPGAALALCLCTMVLAAMLYLCGTCAPLMEAMFRTFAPSADTQLPDIHYGPMAQMITGYLRGDVPAFQYTLTAGDMQYQVFHGYEQAHMADCLGLFLLCRRVLIVSTVLSAVLLVLLKVQRTGKAAAVGFCCGVGTVLALLAVIGIAAAIDFNAVFVLFHQLSFSNSMWLLNPQTDMLIRLMPLSFFIHYVLLIGGVWLLSMLAMLLLGMARIRRK